MHLLPMASSPDGLISARHAVIAKTPGREVLTTTSSWGGGAAGDGAPPPPPPPRGPAATAWHSAPRQIPLRAPLEWHRSEGRRIADMGRLGVGRRRGMRLEPPAPPPPPPAREHRRSLPEEPRPLLASQKLKDKELAEQDKQIQSLMKQLQAQSEATAQLEHDQHQKALRGPKDKLTLGTLGDALAAHGGRPSAEKEGRDAEVERRVKMLEQTLRYEMEAELAAMREKMQHSAEALALPRQLMAEATEVLGDEADDGMASVDGLRRKLQIARTLVAQKDSFIDRLEKQLKQRSLCLPAFCLEKRVLFPPIPGGGGYSVGWNFCLTNSVRNFCAQFVRCF